YWRDWSSDVCSSDLHRRLISSGYASRLIAAPGRVPLMVVAVDVPEELKNLKSTMSSIEAVVDLDALRGEIKRLNEEAAAPDLWDDQAKAQKVTSRLSYVQGELN